jgi:hypothetical protein
MVEMKINIRITIIWILVLITSSLNMITLANSQANDTADIGFDENIVVTYKNEHFNLDENNTRTENITKWNKIKIEDISHSEDEEKVNVTWSLFEAVGVELVDLDYNDDLWNETGLINFTSKIDINDQQSAFGVLFNEKDAVMSDVDKNLLLTPFRYPLFYMNELGHYEDKVDLWGTSTNNTIIKDEITTTIDSAQTRTFEARINGDAQIRLNDTYEHTDEAWFNITLNLKLYLVYGQETNLLLSYNINYTIQEIYWNNQTQSHDTYVERKIIFWNVRRPTKLTTDYPIFEVLRIPAINIPGFEYYLLGSVALYIIYRVSKYSKNKKKLKITTEEGDH